MQRTTHHSAEVGQAATAGPTFPSLTEESRHTVDTDCAAYHLNREPQTLRVWACKENGPLRVHGRLAWPTAEIRRLLGVAA